jgi:glycosyltransferase involved in cell wall biosynthesis
MQNYSVYRLLETQRVFFWGRDPLEFFRPVNFYEFATSRFGMFSVMAAFSFRSYGKLRALHEAHPFDIIHDVQGLGYALLLHRLRGLPVVSNIHHPLQIDRMNRIRQARTFEDKLKWARFYPFFMQEIVARRVDRIITGSHNAQASVARAFRLPLDHIRVVYDGVDADAFRPLEVPKEAGSLLYVGNSDDRNKGARYLVHAVALLQQRGKSVRLTVVDRPNAYLVPKLASELGIGDCVTLTGRVSQEELIQLYNQTEVFVSPSLYEGFGLPAAEAMACGAPLIATTAGAFPEVVEDGVSGMLVQPGDAGALADAIEGLLNDAAERQRLGYEGRKRIIERFSWRETAIGTQALYEDVLDQWKARLA